MFKIEWHDSVSRRSGFGPKAFPEERARQLVDELNRDYPRVVHLLREVGPDGQLLPHEAFIDGAFLHGETPRPALNAEIERSSARRYMP